MKKSLVSILQLHLKQNMSVQIRHASQGLPEFSSTKYKIQRKNFNQIAASDIGYFKSILDETRVITDEDDLLPYNIDWVKNCRGQSKLVLKPKNTLEVSTILKYCNDRRLAVCPQGGNTGVVGGSVPVFDEIILNFALMNKIISLDDVSGSLVCESGCILETLDNYVRDQGLIMPLDLGSKGICQIGGNVSTNAGGLRLLRYGNLHGSILGVEAVKADGTVIDCLKTLKKDNTGYHLKHLFIGSEGTLGIVTKVAIHCPAMPNAVNLGFFGVENFDNILKLYKKAKSNLGEILSAFEMADFDSINSTKTNLNLMNPIADYPFYVLLETHGSNDAHDGEKLLKFLSEEMETGLILDGTVTSEPAKIQVVNHIHHKRYDYLKLLTNMQRIILSIFKLREGIASAGFREGYVFIYDVTLPLKNYYDLLPMLKKRLGDKAIDCYGYGHVGDGNLHITIVVPKYTDEVASLIEPFIFEEVSKMNGSVSAEHGIGVRKPEYLHYSKDQSAVNLMRDLKKLMDPNGILNPYKVLPDLP